MKARKNVKKNVGLDIFAVSSLHQQVNIFQELDFLWLAKEDWRFEFHGRREL